MGIDVPDSRRGSLMARAALSRIHHAPHLHAFRRDDASRRQQRRNMTRHGLT
jgi:hypothetical protein